MVVSDKWGNICLTYGRSSGNIRSTIPTPFCQKQVNFLLPQNNILIFTAKFKLQNSQLGARRPSERVCVGWQMSANNSYKLESERQSLTSRAAKDNEHFHQGERLMVSDSCPHSMAPTPAALGLPGNSLEMQILGSPPDLLIRNCGYGSEIGVLTSPPNDADAC